ncbi:MAG: hypothetical protein IPL23_30755 [Saprospiraceae bacterium]|nr:hypothetical protein [Saprospiraceae bacterium]
MTAFAELENANLILSDGNLRTDEYIRVDSSKLILDNVTVGVNYLTSGIDSIGFNIMAGSIFSMTNTSNLFILGNKNSITFPAFNINENGVLIQRPILLLVLVYHFPGSP